MTEDNGMATAYKQRLDQLEALIKDLQDLKVMKASMLKEYNEKIHQKEQDLFELVDVDINQGEIDLGSAQTKNVDDTDE